MLLPDQQVRGDTRVGQKSWLRLENMETSQKLTVVYGPVGTTPGMKRKELEVLGQVMAEGEAAVETTSHSILVAVQRTKSVEVVEALTRDDRCCQWGSKKDKAAPGLA